MQTPQQQHPSQPAIRYAHWWKRALGAVIDWAIFAIPTFLLFIPMLIWFVQNAEQLERADPQTFPAFPIWFALTWAFASLLLTAGTIAYQIVLNGNQRGQTVGKMAMGIQVRNVETLGPLGYGRAAARYFVGYALMLACWIPGIVDYLFPLWDDKRQTIHDKAAGSIVVDLRAN